MRPVQRGASPQATDFANYADAKPFLVSRLGCYCSYCERRVATNLAVEHIQPKGLPAYKMLTGRWSNFLLGCVNCNSTKNDKDVVLAALMLPDRDNSFAAFDYFADGRIEPSAALSAGSRSFVEMTLSLVGLDKAISVVLDENSKQVALDRVSQRMEVWGVASDAKADIDADPANAALRQATVRTARGYGFFSIWMTVFAGDANMRNRLIDGFEGTRGSGCFHPATTTPVSPAPNPDALADGGKL
jgi:uncharacterized protein (TIGR02646 family)